MSGAGEDGSALNTPLLTQQAQGDGPSGSGGAAVQSRFPRRTTSPLAASSESSRRSRSAGRQDPILGAHHMRPSLGGRQRGAIVGGLIIGASEKLAEVYLGPYVGGGIEGWFPYVLALVFLLIRPEGLFGEQIIRRI